MAGTPSRPVLVTGASGGVGRPLVRALAAAGWTLVLSDIVAFPDPVPPGAAFRLCDLANQMEVMRLAEGCGTVVHLGGAATDDFPFEATAAANLHGAYHVYEAARRAGARVVFASTNHVTGFHERGSRLDAGCEMRPDSFYGLSKAYGELMARLYWDKHGVESVILRIGSCFPEPVDRRMLSLWLSYGDMARLVMAAATAQDVGGVATIWAASDNARGFWGEDDRARIGWAPQDSADGFADRLMGKVSGNEVAERFQGGMYCARGS